MNSSTVDTDALPPTQYLILEVLAARHRTGEQTWTFPSRLTAAMRALEAAGLIGWKSGIVQNAVLAWLTDAGRAATLSDGYVAPATRTDKALDGAWAAVWLHGDWRELTTEMTTGQREAAADAVDRWRATLGGGAEDDVSEETRHEQRWWRY